MLEKEARINQEYLMGHVGDGLYKCAKCLGVANA